MNTPDADLARWDADGAGSTFRKYYAEHYELAVSPRARSDRETEQAGHFRDGTLAGLSAVVQSGPPVDGTGDLRRPGTATIQPSNGADSRAERTLPPLITIAYRQLFRCPDGSTTMKFGWLTLALSPSPDQDAVRIDEQIAQVCAAEALGFDDVWLTEHYFTGESVV